ncbi:Serine/threonine-protein phosphatase 2A activator, partial [Stylophora pistillata]
MRRRLTTVFADTDGEAGEAPVFAEPKREILNPSDVVKWEKSQNADRMIQGLLPEKSIGASIELTAYLRDGFGNKTRIDYGTGHEACFIAFLCCLFKLRVLDQNDCVSIVFKVFQ